MEGGSSAICGATYGLDSIAKGALKDPVSLLFIALPEPLLIAFVILVAVEVKILMVHLRLKRRNLSL